MTATGHFPRGGRSSLLFFIRWAVALLILGLLIYLLPLEPLRNAMARVPLTRLLIVLFIYLIALSVGTAKWHMVVNTAGARLPFIVSARCYTSGLFGALFLPSIVGGDAARLAVGIPRSSHPATLITGNLADRFLDAAAQVTLIFIGLLLLPGSLPPQLQNLARRLLFIGGIVATLLLILALLLYRPLLRGRSIRFRRVLARLCFAMRSVSRRPHILVLGWLLGTSVQTTFLVLTALLGMSCGLYLPLRVWLIAWPLAKIAAILPFTQGGIGVREAALIALLVPFGAPASLALATGIVWEGIIIAGGLIAGLTAFLIHRLESRATRA